MPGYECDHLLPAPGERPMQELGAAELLVAGALRAWVAPLLAPAGRHPDWRRYLALGGVVAEGAEAFDRLMRLLAHSARRSLDVRCCRCPGLSPDEAALLQLTAAVQAGQSFAALDVLMDWLPEPALMPALAAARDFGAALQRAGAMLPAPALAPPCALATPSSLGPQTLH
ncbi:hypothetical protein [Falsiroseomonas tokyonensis]|uniref:YecA family protein n=1 Tax=Falsiroseomonas tokyonensis TaxID=430521 RepID=A0ABV7C065_9PROT|nr:hypothetical protein [Falsiroseomonas tokyonensis]MBU8541179.1 hypothetical protein [Falsiroseomonas tokyonensis]